MMATVKANRHRAVTPARRLVKAAAIALALLFVMLRPVCEVFAASGEWHGPAIFEHSEAQMADASAAGHSDDGICCASVDAQALTVPATAPLPTMSSDMLAPPSSAVLQVLTSLALTTNLVARRDPAPPLPYHARSLRRLD